MACKVHEKTGVIVAIGSGNNKSTHGLWSSYSLGSIKTRNQRKVQRSHVKSQSFRWSFCTFWSLVRTIQCLTCNLLFAVICRTCRGSLDQDAKPHELLLTGSTFKSVPRQSRVRKREVCDTRVALGSLVSSRSISSQDENVSIYLPEGELERKHLATLNNALTSISECNFEPFLQYIDYDWNETSEKTKRQYIKESGGQEAITLVLSTVAPSKEEPLWQSVIKHHLSHERPTSTLVLDAGVEAIVAAYNESEDRSTRIQILSLMCQVQPSRTSATYPWHLQTTNTKCQTACLGNRCWWNEGAREVVSMLSRHGQSQGVHSFFQDPHLYKMLPLVLKSWSWTLE